MSFGKIKIRRSDTLFRQYLLKLRGERCEHCGRKGKVEVSHFFGRRKEATRYCEKNCSLLCNYCHRTFHERPADYVEWMKEKLGDGEYKKLVLASNTYCKRDDKLACLYLKEKIKKL